jgi:probable O-glycosylation ligase (exosortase A-associated)
MALASSAWLGRETSGVERWRGTSSEGSSPAEESRLPFQGVMAFTFILLMAPQKIFPVLAPLRPALVAATVAVIGLFVHRVARREPLTIFPREMWLATCLAAWVIITLPLSLWPGGSVAFLLDLYLKSLAIFWLLPNAVNTPSRLRRLAWALSLMSVPLALTALRNFFSGEFMLGARGVTRILGYDAPLTQNPNDQALMLNLLLPLGVGLFLSRPRPVFRVILAAAIALDVAGIIVTFSRAGFLTLVAIAIAYAWKLRRRPERRWLLAALLIGLLCLPLAPAGYKQRLATVMNTAADPTGSAQARRADTFAALRWVADNPVVGAGIGQDTLAMNLERGPRWKAMHNVYLEYAVELGLPGLVLYLLLMGSCLHTTASVERRARHDPALAGLIHLAGAIRISLIAFAVGGFFHPVAYHFYFYYMAGLAVALKAAGDEASARAATAAEPLRTQHG